MLLTEHIIRPHDGQKELIVDIIRIVTALYCYSYGGGVFERNIGVMLTETRT
jgi:hypothetical protein